MLSSAKGAGPEPGPDLGALIFRAGLFDAGWYGATHADVALSGLDPATHFRRFGLALGRLPCPDLAARLAPGADPALIPPTLKPAELAALRRHFLPAKPPARAAGRGGRRAPPATPPEFDEAFYLRSNPDIDLSRAASPYDHFLRWGHRRFRNPAPDFDLAWYALTHGHDFATPDENPFLHYLRVGKARGDAGCPPATVRLDPAGARPLPANPRRACLFAGYDPGLRIDDYVLIWLRELARHADVFYLADGDLPPSELARLDGIVAGAWALRHGAYDFGSYSRLACDLVGWDRLAGYDEVLFVNDSCYLLQPLDRVLAEMAARPCAWWGMQATKGLAITRDSQPFPAPGDTMPVRDLDEAMLSRFEREPVYDFHMGSYFLAFRRPVLDDPRFRRMLAGVRPEPNKFTIIRKYEVGLTRLLIGAGHAFDTFAPVITRRHPVYTDVLFDLIRDGFPLFKRFLVTDNPYRVSALALWPLVVGARPDLLTPLPVIQANLRRLARDDRLQANLAVTGADPAPPPPDPAALAEADRQAPKFAHVWGFAVHPEHHGLGGDMRALLEAVKDDPGLTKIVFTRSRPLPATLTGVHLRAVPLASEEGRALLSRCGRIFLETEAGAELDWPEGVPLAVAGRQVIRLGGQVPPPEGAAGAGLAGVVSLCATDIDRLTLTASHPGAQVWQTGLPRQDLLEAEVAALPPDLQDQARDLAARLAGRGLVLIAPAPRGPKDPAPLVLSAAEAAGLGAWLQAQGLVAGLWEEVPQAALPQLLATGALKLPPAAFPEAAMLCRAARLVVTDRPDLARDALQAGCPVIRLAPPPAVAACPDPAAILSDLSVRDGAGLMQALTVALATPPEGARRAAQRALLCGPDDGGNTRRLLAQLRADPAAPPPAPQSGPQRILLVSGADPGTARLAPWLAALPAAQWQARAAAEVRPADLAGVDVLILDRPPGGIAAFDLLETARAGGARLLCDVSDRDHDFEARIAALGLEAARDQANALHLAAVERRAVLALADTILLADPAPDAVLRALGKPLLPVTTPADLKAVLQGGERI